MPPTYQQSEKVVSAEGTFDFKEANTMEPDGSYGPPCLWEVSVWVRGAMLFTPLSFTALNYAALMLAVDTDSPIQQFPMSGGQFTPGARTWLPLGPRGSRITVFGQSVRVQLMARGDGTRVIASTHRMNVVCRIAPVPMAFNPPAQPVQQVFRGTLNGSWEGYFQLPAFSTEYRIAGTYGLYDQHGFTDGSRTAGAVAQLTDPWTGTIERRYNGQAFDWTPLPTYAAGVYCNGTMMTR